MGKKLDALLGRRTVKTPNFKPLIRVTISRISVLKDHRQVRCSQSRSEVSQNLNLGNHERDLLRVEQVIKEQNMLDAFVMMENYCHLLTERVDLIENSKECPDEVKEALSSLIFASSRCGEFPELQEIRAFCMLKYGKEFVARALELRNNCGVSPKIIQKMSTRQPSLENRIKVLKEIASENGIALQLEEESHSITKENLDLTQNKNQSESTHSTNSNRGKLSDETESVKARKYHDVASAAQAAFESAAYAAEAARAAVELSRSGSQDIDPDDEGSSTSRRRYSNRTDYSGSLKSRTPRSINGGLDVEKIVSSENSESESESEVEELTEKLGSIKSKEHKERMNRKDDHM